MSRITDLEFDQIFDFEFDRVEYLHRDNECDTIFSIWSFHLCS